MCSHPDHEVTTLPDGQVVETHVITAEQADRMLEVFRRREPVAFFAGEHA